MDEEYTITSILARERLLTLDDSGKIIHQQNDKPKTVFHHFTKQNSTTRNTREASYINPNKSVTREIKS